MADFVLREWSLEPYPGDQAPLHVHHRGDEAFYVLTTISDLINVFSAAGLWIETAIEPQLSQDDRHRYPHKQEWMNKYLGILIFKLRPLPAP